MSMIEMCDEGGPVRMRDQLGARNRFRRKAYLEGSASAGTLIARSLDCRDRLNERGFARGLVACCSEDVSERGCRTARQFSPMTAIRGSGTSTAAPVALSSSMTFMSCPLRLALAEAETPTAGAADSVFNAGELETIAEASREGIERRKKENRDEQQEKLDSVLREPRDPPQRHKGVTHKGAGKVSEGVRWQGTEPTPRR